MLHPPLPPRRSVPPPPPILTTNPPVEAVQHEKPISIADRIANLQLSHTAFAPIRLPPPPPPEPQASEEIEYKVAGVKPASRPPPIPPKWTRPSREELSRALARKPPPPPIKKSVLQAQNPPNPPDPPPRRRVPPTPSHLPSLPPTPEPQYQQPVPDSYTASCLECRDFSHVDTHAALFPRDTVTSLDNLAYDLTEPFPYEIEKARAIFTWLHHNIAYDAESFFSGNIQACTPETTLLSGLAVCDGYSSLFKSLAEMAGIQAHKVTGHGKGVGYEATGPGQPVPQYSGNHAWNCAFLDGNWYLIDACWGAGALNGSTYNQRFAPMWFTSTPREFGRTHFPEDPSYQLVADDQGGPVSWYEYIMEPAGPTIFVDFYQLTLWPSALQPSTRNIQGGSRTTFYVFKRCVHLSTLEADNFIYMVSFGNERVLLELNAEGGWSVDVYIPRDVNEVSLYYVTTVNGKDAKGISMRALRGALGHTAMSFGGLAKWAVV